MKIAGEGNPVDDYLLAALQEIGSPLGDLPDLRSLTMGLGPSRKVTWTTGETTLVPTGATLLHFFAYESDIKFIPTQILSSSFPFEPLLGCSSETIVIGRKAINNMVKGMKKAIKDVKGRTDIAVLKIKNLEDVIKIFSNKKHKAVLMKWDDECL